MKRQTTFIAAAWLSSLALTPLVAQESENGATIFEERLITKVPGKHDVKSPFIDWWMVSRNGRNVAYVARRRFGKDIRECIIFGDRIGPYFNWVMRPALSPDGRQLAYLASETRGKEDLPLFILLGDKMKQVQFQETTTSSNWNPVFSPDGTKVVFQMELNGKHANVVADVDEATFVESSDPKAFAELAGSIGPGFDVVDKGVFSPDSKRLAYSASDGGKWFIVLDGNKGPEFDDAWPPVFGPDSARIAYRAARNGKWRIMIDDESQPLYDQVSNPAFSPDGSVVAYVAEENGKFFMMVGDVRREKKELCDHVVFSRDGSDVSCWSIRKTRNKQSVLMWDAVGPEFDQVGLHPVFSPDVRTAAYWARKGNKYRIILGNDKGPEFDGLDFDPLFSADGSKVGYVALKGREFWWKVMDVP